MRNISQCFGASRVVPARLRCRTKRHAPTLNCKVIQDTSTGTDDMDLFGVWFLLPPSPCLLLCPRTRQTLAARQIGLLIALAVM